jgi:hypothetical protein
MKACRIVAKTIKFRERHKLVREKLRNGFRDRLEGMRHCCIKTCIFRDF